MKPAIRADETELTVNDSKIRANNAIFLLLCVKAGFHRRSCRSGSRYVNQRWHTADSIKVALGIENWQLAIGHLGLQNNAMSCLSDPQTIAS